MLIKKQALFGSGHPEVEHCFIFEILPTYKDLNAEQEHNMSQAFICQ